MVPIVGMSPPLALATVVPFLPEAQHTGGLDAHLAFVSKLLDRRTHFLPTASRSFHRGLRSALGRSGLIAMMRKPSASLSFWISCDRLGYGLQHGRQLCR